MPTENPPPPFNDLPSPFDVPPPMPSVPSPSPSPSTLRSLERDLHNTLRRFFEEADERPEPATRTWAPQTDVRETDTEYRIDMDLPGVSEGDLTIDADGYRLVVRGERPAPEPTEDETVLRKERLHGRFSRRLTLPPPARLDEASAEIAEGTLTIHVPKAHTESSRDIPIS